MLSFTPWRGDEPTLHVDPDYVIAVLEQKEHDLQGQEEWIALLYLSGGSCFSVKDPERAVKWRIQKWKENV